MTIITRIYETPEQARRAVVAINGLNNPEVETSLLGGEGFDQRYNEVLVDHNVAVTTEQGTPTATGIGIGAAVGGGTGLLAGLGMLAIPGIGPLVAAGWLVTAAAGALAGGVAGGAVGAVAELGMAEEDTPVYSEAVRRGGVIVTVRTPDAYAQDVELALDTVASLNMADLRNRYQDEGWRIDETEQERVERLARLRDDRTLL